MSGTFGALRAAWAGGGALCLQGLKAGIQPCVLRSGGRQKNMHFRETRSELEPSWC